MPGSENGSRYHHGDLRQAILDAACEHLKHENADTLSLRALAREIGVSQTAPYRHLIPAMHCLQRLLPGGSRFWKLKCEMP